tara:strand:- start:6 stop:1133 length:1128 start_codon:yes stop_codon:yes gene_type:complete
MDKLLKEAIADAKAVRETALANAKIALEEAFTPHLKSMLSKKLQAEMEGEDEEKADENYYGEDEEEIEENDVSSEIGASDNKEPGKAGDTSGVGQGPESEGSDEEAGNEDENLEKAPEQPLGEDVGMEDEDEDEVAAEEVGMEDEDEDEVAAEEAGMEDEDEDLEEVLRQLEAEMNDEDEEVEENMEDENEDEVAAEEAGMEDENEDEVAAEEAGMEDEDDEIDLDEIIKALTEEEGMEDEDEEVKEEMEDEDEDSELEEYKQTVQYLRDKLSEVNLLNAKLLYTNKLFRSRNISEAQKMKVIEQFDRAANVREVKLVFSTFAESMKRKSVNESVNAKRVSQASKPTASTQPKKKPIIGESTDFKSRMKKLANII